MVKAMIKLDKREEDIISSLTKLYKTRGFKRYKSVCFEEYSFYQDNKDFLIGKNVITFSDLCGRLMAMRPDVTLSLVRHAEIDDKSAEKYYYTEKVYRQAATGNDYKEICQTGVEVVGLVDDTVIAELTILICDTLSAVSGDYVLDISHMGFTEGLLNEFPTQKHPLAELLRTKNLHDFYKLAQKEGYGEELVKAFNAAVSAVGNPENVLKLAESCVLNNQMSTAVNELKTLYASMKKFGYGDKINIDFSAVGNAEYYNGVIFNGYLKGVPHCVLTGGRYDKLLDKMGKSGGAIGFALYLGEIERYLTGDDDDVDCLIIYDKLTKDSAMDKAQRIISNGQSVRLSTAFPMGLTVKNTIDLTRKGGTND